MGITGGGCVSWETGQDILGRHKNRLSVGTSPAPQSPHESYSCRIDQGSDATNRGWLSLWGDSTTTSSTQWTTVNWYYRIDASGGGTIDHDVIRIGTPPSGTSNTYHLKILYDQSTGDLKLYNAAGTNFDNVLDPLADNTWYKMALKFNESSTGKVRFYIDDTLVAWSDSTNISHATAGNTVCFEAQLGTVSAQVEVYLGSAFYLHDDGADITTNETWFPDKVWHHKILQETALADGNNDLTTPALPSPANFNNGTWADVGELLLDDTDYLEYTSMGPVTRSSGITLADGSSSARAGPRDDADIDVTGNLVVHCGWFWRIKKQSGTGNVYFRGRYGMVTEAEYTSDAGTNNTTAGTEWGLGTSWTVRSEHASLDDTECPTLDDWAQYAISARGAGIFANKVFRCSWAGVACFWAEDAPSGLIIIDGKGVPK